MPLLDLPTLRARLTRDQRLIGIDPGAKTIGLALSDVRLMLASPYGSLKRGRLKANAVEIAAINSQRMRFSDDANYVTRYDLSNPVTTGAGDTLRSAAYTPNRATDVASAGVGVSAEAVSASVANTLTVTLAPLMAILQQVVQALATATTSTANVVNQAQPKTAA